MIHSNGPCQLPTLALSTNVSDDSASDTSPICTAGLCIGRISWAVGRFRFFVLCVSNKGSRQAIMESTSGGSNRRLGPACDPCRKRKLRCNRKLPCSMCMRSRREECRYYQGQTRLDVTTPSSIHSRTQATATASELPKTSSLNASVQDPASDIQDNDAPSTVLAASSSATIPLAQTNSQSPETHSAKSLATGVWHHSTLGSIFIGDQSFISSQTDSSPSQRDSTAVVQRSGVRTSQSSPNGSEDNNETSKDKHNEPDGWILSLRGLTAPVKGIVFKNRCIGQSHWLQTAMLVRNLPVVPLPRHSITWPSRLQEYCNGCT
jgi:hypothetical protein